MMSPIEKRCGQRDTHAFVTTDTVDLLAAKLVGIVADRRVTKAHRFLGEQGGNTPRLFPGLRVWRGGYGGPTTVRAGQSVSVCLVDQRHHFEGVGFRIGRDDETEEQAAERYYHPERQWLGERRDVTVVELRGFPGSPSPEDTVRIEQWNENGVGQETVVAFDDIDLLQELAWTVKGDKVREMHLDDEFCTGHGLHIEHPNHRSGVACVLRRSTLAENLVLLAVLAAQQEAATAATTGE